MNPSRSISRRSILRLMPAAAAAATAVVLSAKGALAQNAAQSAGQNRQPTTPVAGGNPSATPNYRGIIGML